MEPGKVTRWACCDCGLVHDIAFVVEGGVIGVAVHRNNRATAQRRVRIKLATVTEPVAVADKQRY